MPKYFTNQILQHFLYFRSPHSREEGDEEDRPAGVRREAELPGVGLSAADHLVVQGRRGHQQLRLGEVGVENVSKT